MRSAGEPADLNQIAGKLQGMAVARLSRVLVMLPPVARLVVGGQVGGAELLIHRTRTTDRGRAITVRPWLPLQETPTPFDHRLPRTVLYHRCGMPHPRLYNRAPRRTRLLAVDVWGHVHKLPGDLYSRYRHGGRPPAGACILPCPILSTRKCALCLARLPQEPGLLLLWRGQWVISIHC